MTVRPTAVVVYNWRPVFTVGTPQLALILVNGAQLTAVAHV